MIFTNIDDYFDTKEAFLDAFIDHGSEQELFISSYIHGHFSVEAAKVCSLANMQVSQRIAMFETNLRLAIDNAIGNQELASSDASDVVAMLEQVFQA